MAESHVVSGLEAKRSELAGLVSNYKSEIKRLNEEIRMLGEAIKLFDPEYKVEAIKTKHINKNNAFFERNEASRMIFDLLRTSDKPISTVEITQFILEKKNVDPSQSKALQATLVNTLHKIKKKSQVQIVSIDKRNCYAWELVG